MDRRSCVRLYTYIRQISEDLWPTWDTYYRAEAGENVAAKLSKYIYTYTTIYVRESGSGADNLYMRRASLS